MYLLHNNNLIEAWMIIRVLHDKTFFPTQRSDIQNHQKKRPSRHHWKSSQSNRGGGSVFRLIFFPPSFASQSNQEMNCNTGFYVKDTTHSKRRLQTRRWLAGSLSGVFSCRSNYLDYLRSEMQFN